MLTGQFDCHHSNHLPHPVPFIYSLSNTSCHPPHTPSFPQPSKNGCQSNSTVFQSVRFQFLVQPERFFPGYVIQNHLENIILKHKFFKANVPQCSVPLPECWSIPYWPHVLLQVAITGLVVGATPLQKTTYSLLLYCQDQQLTPQMNMTGVVQKYLLEIKKTEN